MEPLVTIRHLEPEQAMLAFPLVREVVGDVTLDDWQETAFKLTCESSDKNAQGGIVVAERNGFPRGLFTYETTYPAAPKCNFVVRNFVVMELVGRNVAAGVLFDHMGVLARQLSCERILIYLPTVSAWVRSNWDELTRSELNIAFACSE